MAPLAHDPDARVLLEHHGAVVLLTLNRPEKLNAADLPMQRQLLERWQQLNGDERVRAIVLTGAGRAFCAGGDVAFLQDEQRSVRDELSRIHGELLPAMLRCPVPTLAAVHGPAVGFGAELAALCDLVVMDEDAFLCDPHVRHGLPASPGCQLMWPHLTSLAVAKELMLTGRQVDADEAVRLGLANRVTARGDDGRVALELAAELAAMPAAGIAEIKRASNAPVLDELARLEIRRGVVRVVDLATDVAGRFAAKLLAMAGLDVVRPGPADDSPRGRYLDLHKRTVGWPDDDASTRGLFADADVVFTTFDRGGMACPVADAAVPTRSSTCVEVTTSSYGMTGPYAGRRGGPLAEWAAGGYLAITGWPDREPLIGPEDLCGFIGGYTAAIAAEAALRQRERTGRGVHVDLSTMESMLNVHQSTFSRLAAGIVRERSGRYTEVYPLVVRPCRDGYVSLGVVTDVEFDRLMIAIDRPELAADDRFRDVAARWVHRDALDGELAGFLDAHDADDVVRILDAHGLAVAKVAEVDDVLANPQLADRGFWDVITVDGAPGRVPGNPVPASVDFDADADPAVRAPAFPTAPRNDQLPLADVTVLDFSAFWAGPSATRILADLGARVLWVERPHSRREPDATSDGTEVVMHYFHLKMNRNKESVILDLTTPEGRDLARRLALEVDVVVENFRPGVMDTLGLGPDSLGRENPALVYASLSGFGSRGPWSDRRSYGPTIEAASSIEARTGYAGGEPLRLGHTLPDGAGGLMGALAVLRGLRERAERGTGGWFDLSQLEAYAAISGDELLVAATSGRGLERIGNRSRTGALQGVFPCAGTDEWIAIRLADPRDVAALAEVVGGRVVAETAEGVIASYTAGRDKHALAEELQAVGLEAFPVLTPVELSLDPHLLARGFFVDVEIGDTTVRLPGTPLHALAEPSGAAPRFGQHTEAVLAALAALPPRD